MILHRSSSRALPIALVSSIFVAGAACKRAESRPGSVGTLGAGGIDALAAKSDPYIECLNTFSQDVSEGRSSYLDSFDGEKGPSEKDLKKGRLYGPKKLQDAKACIDGMAAAEKREPRMPKLEAAGQAYVVALQKLVPIYAELDPYFDREDYRDDGLAKAKARHGELMAAWKAFAAADRALSDEVDVVEDQVQQARLAELEKSEGRKLRWLHTRLMASAKRALRAGLSEPAEMDLAKLQAAVGDYEAHWGELKAYTGAHKAEVDKQVSAYWRIEGPAEELLKAGKAVMRRARDKEAFTATDRSRIEGGSAEYVEGHPASLMRAYNRLVDLSNGIQFRVME